MAPKVWPPPSTGMRRVVLPELAPFSSSASLKPTDSSLVPWMSSQGTAMRPAAAFDVQRSGVLLDVVQHVGVEREHLPGPRVSHLASAGLHARRCADPCGQRSTLAMAAQVTSALTRESLAAWRTATPPPRE